MYVSVFLGNMFDKVGYAAFHFQSSYICTSNMKHFDFKMCLSERRSLKGSWSHFQKTGIDDSLIHTLKTHVRSLIWLNVFNKYWYYENKQIPIPFVDIMTMFFSILSQK